MMDAMRYGNETVVTLDMIDAHRWDQDESVVIHPSLSLSFALEMSDH